MTAAAEDLFISFIWAAETARRSKRRGTNGSLYTADVHPRLPAVATDRSAHTMLALSILFVATAQAAISPSSDSRRELFSYSPTGPCEDWCETHENGDWSAKCQWANCHGCAVCAPPSPPPPSSSPPPSPPPPSPHPPPSPPPPPPPSPPPPSPSPTPSMSPPIPSPSPPKKPPPSSSPSSPPPTSPPEATSPTAASGSGTINKQLINEPITSASALTSGGSNGGVSTPALVGSIVGGICALLLMMIGVIYMCMCKRRRESGTDYPKMSPPLSPKSPRNNEEEANELGEGTEASEHSEDSINDVAVERRVIEPAGGPDRA